MVAEWRGAGAATQPPPCNRWSGSRAGVQLISGLDHANATPGPDGAGEVATRQRDFPRRCAGEDAGADIHAGISIDQVNNRQSYRPPHPLSLTGLDLRFITAFRQVRFQFFLRLPICSLSWRSPTTPLAPEANPRTVRTVDVWRGFAIGHRTSNSRPATAAVHPGRRAWTTAQPRKDT